MYEEVADNPDAEFHFYHGREAAERFGYSAAEAYGVKVVMMTTLKPEE